MISNMKEDIYTSIQISLPLRLINKIKQYSKILQTDESKLIELVLKLYLNQFISKVLEEKAYKIKNEKIH